MCHIRKKINQKITIHDHHTQKHAAFSTRWKSHIKKIKLKTYKGVQIVNELNVTCEELMIECVK